MTQDPQTRRRFMRRTGAAMTVAGTASLASTTASAETTQQGILADGIPGETESDLQAFLLGQLEGFSVRPPAEDAATYADRLRNEFNANSADWINYGNWLIDEYDVQALGDTTVGVEVRIDRWITGIDAVQTTIDAGYDTDRDEFTNLEWRLEEPDEPDYEGAVIDDAAKNGADELAAFRREFIDTDGNGDHTLPSSAYLSRHAGKYAQFIELGDDGQTVFELLLGEVRS